MSGYIGHYYYLLNGELIIDKCSVQNGQSIDGIIIRKRNYTHLDIVSDGIVFQGDVIYNIQQKQFEVSHDTRLSRNFIFKNLIRKYFKLKGIYEFIPQSL